jgi:hypothetical protein
MSAGEIAAAKEMAARKLAVDSDPALMLEREQARHREMLEHEENAYIESVAASGALAEEGEIAPGMDFGPMAQMGWDANPAEGRAMEDSDFNMFVASPLVEALSADPESEIYAIPPPGFFRDTQGNYLLIEMIGGVEVRSRADIGYEAYDVVVLTSYGDRQIGHTRSLADARELQQDVAIMVARNSGLLEEDSGETERQSGGDTP